MRKSKATRESAGRAYADEIMRRIPGSHAEVLLDAPGGFDVWVRIEIPQELMDSDEDFMGLTLDLNSRFRDETGVHIVATLVEKEPVHG